MSDRVGSGRGAVELAREFDRSFTDPARVAVEDVERLLAIRVRGDGFAVRLRDVTGLVADRKIVALPSRVPALLGIVGLRSGVAPVYSLGALLGYGAIRAAPRWLLLVGPGPLFGLAFEDFDGHRQAGRADISSSQGDGSGAHVPESVFVDGARLGLMSITALTGTIETLAANNDRNKES